MKKSSNGNRGGHPSSLASREAIGIKRRELLSEAYHMRVLCREAKRMGDDNRYTLLSQMLKSCEVHIEFMVELEKVNDPKAFNKRFVRDKLQQISEHTEDCIRLVANEVFAGKSPCARNRVPLHWSTRLKSLENN